MTVELSQEQKDQLVGGGECFLHSHTPDQITGLVELVLQEVPGPEPIPPGTYLVPANNLSDVASIVTTLTNLGLDQVDNTSDLDKPVSTAASAALSGKANAVHSHVIGDVTGLQAALDGKAASSHTHTIANVTGLQTSLDGKEVKMPVLTVSDSGGYMYGGANAGGLNCVNVWSFASQIHKYMPPSPAVGDKCIVVIANGRTDNMIYVSPPGNEPIMGLNETMTIDRANIAVTFLYAGGAIGWRIL